MKPSTKFYLAIFFILVGALFINWQTSMFGVIIMCISSYLVGKYFRDMKIDVGNPKPK